MFSPFTTIVLVEKHLGSKPGLTLERDKGSSVVLNNIYWAASSLKAAYCNKQSNLSNESLEIYVICEQYEQFGAILWENNEKLYTLLFLSLHNIGFKDSNHSNSLTCTQWYWPLSNTA